MGREVGGTFRHPSLGKIMRAPADNTADRAGPGRDQTAVSQLADPDRNIEMLFHKIDHAVGPHEPNVDVGIGFEELDCDGKNVQTAKDDWGGDGQITFRRAEFSRCCTLGIADVFENAPAGRDVGSSRVGQGPVAGWSD
jgi:hypothetical protein